MIMEEVSGHYDHLPHDQKVELLEVTTEQMWNAFEYYQSLRLAVAGIKTALQLEVSVPVEPSDTSNILL